MLIFACVLLLGGCAVSNSNEDVSMSEKEQLIFLAQEEGELVVYSITTRLEEAAVLFEEEYGIKVVFETLDGGELISRVNAEVSNGTFGADVVLAQDSGRVQMELLDSGLLENYVPESVAEYISENDSYPLVHQYVNKVFMINGSAEDIENIINVWQLTEPQYEGKIYFKDPFDEDVNLNFLTMITANDWSEKLKESYESYYGEELVLSEGCPNAGYEWISRMAQNVVLGESDTSITNIVGDSEATDLLGLFVYSKIRYSEENNLDIYPLTNLEPFSGFLYPVYVMMTSNSQHPYASQLFIEFLITEDGFSPWASDVGSYSSNSQLANNDDDYELEYWKEHLVVEDPIYISQNLTEVTSFVASLMEKIK